MASVASIIRSLGRIPGMIGGAFVDEEPIMRPGMRRDSLRIPGVRPYDDAEVPGMVGVRMSDLADDAEVSDVETPTGSLEQVGVRRRPSRLARGLGEALAGTADRFVTAMNAPVRGNAVGTIGQFTGAVGAIRDEQERRDMRDYSMNRQQEQDAQRAEMHGAQMDRWAADAERDRAMAQYQQYKAANPTKAEQYRQFLEVAIGQYGMTPVQANAAWSNQYDPSAKPTPPPNTVESVYARELAENPDPDRRAAALKELSAAATAKRGVPFMRPITADTEAGKRVFDIQRLPDGSLGEPKAIDLPFARPQRPAPSRQPRSATPGQARSMQGKALASEILAQNGGDPKRALAAAAADPRVQPYLAEVTKELQALAGNQQRLSKGESSPEDRLNKALERLAGPAPVKVTTPPFVAPSKKSGNPYR